MPVGADHVRQARGPVDQGTKRPASGGRVYDYHAGQYLIASVDMPVTAYFAKASPGYLGSVSVAVRHRRTTVAGSPGYLPDLARDTPSGLAVSNASAELVEAFVRLLRPLDRPRDINMPAPLIHARSAGD